ncbi:MAG: putative transrane protein [Polaromonas sp.]|nr:putative transrane protein [Polaromonas sp.]
MNRLLDSFWRAAMYCLHPRVMALSVLPVVVMGALTLSLGYFYWENALAAMRGSLASYELVNAMAHWLNGMGLGSLQLVLAPALVLFLAIPAIVIATLLFVALFMTPSMLAMVAGRRFPQLERKRGGSFMGSVARSLGSTLLAVIALAATVPLWLVPPLIVILPPLIWGWLTYRVMSYDALADHASREERDQLFRENRGTLLGIGVLSGYLGAAPSLLWASGAMFIAMAPILVPLAIWIYTLVFAFSSLWFSHYCLGALELLRRKNNGLAQDIPVQEAVDWLAATPLADVVSPPAPRID